MTTRLDRLLVILDSGSTPVTRKAAAQQLGEVQRIYPHELTNLLNRVHVYLRSKNWDTRIAAAQAVEAIARNTPAWNPDGVKVKEEPVQANGCSLDNAVLNVANGDALTSEVSNCDDRLTFEQFDIARVLERGEKLLGSAGDEFDNDQDAQLIGLSQQELLSRQRKILRGRLGLDAVGGLDAGMENLLEDDDLVMMARSDAVVQRQGSTENAAHLVAAQIEAIHSNTDMSSREKNMAKRKARFSAKQHSKENFKKSASVDSGLDEAAPAKRQRRTQSVLVEQPDEDSKVVLDSVLSADEDALSTLDELEEWPFEKFTAELSVDLFHSSWEVRHGAASALREVVKLHGSGAGRTRDIPVREMHAANTRWLEDTALKLLCVFALDRFGDYVSDEVVSPVHETCAQTLGSVLHHASDVSVHRILAVLVKLQARSEWQVRHGALLGLKYLLAVKKSMSGDLLPQILPWITRGLLDGDDDVRAVAAAALLPVADSLANNMPNEIPSMIRILWSTLLDLDDLTSSTTSVMNLLACLLQRNTDKPVKKEPQSKPDEELIEDDSQDSLMSRLWPFLQHSNSSVRHSALKTMTTLMASSDDKSWLNGILTEQLRHLFQCIVTECSDEIRFSACQVWSTTISQGKTSLKNAATQLFSLCSALLVQPSNTALSPVLLLQGTNIAAQKPVNGETNGEVSGHIHLGGASYFMNETQKESQALLARTAGAKALGQLLFHLRSTNPSDEHLLSNEINTIVSYLNSQSATQRTVAAMIVQEWSRCQPTQEFNGASEPFLFERLSAKLSDDTLYSEVVSLHQRLQLETHSLLLGFRAVGVDLFSGGPPPPTFHPDTAALLATDIYQKHISLVPASSVPSVDMKRKTVLATVNEMQAVYQTLHTRVQCSVAGALISSGRLTEKLNPLIRPIMDGVKREEDLTMQRQVAQTLAQLLVKCADRDPCPNTKIVNNLCKFACADPNHTPTVQVSPPPATTPTTTTAAPIAAKRKSRLQSQNSLDVDNSSLSKCCSQFGILTLLKRQKQALKNMQSKRKISQVNSKLGEGISSLESGDGTSTDTDERLLQLQRRGAEMALSNVTSRLGDRLPTILPVLWNICYTVLTHHQTGVNSGDVQEDQVKHLITSLQVLETIAESLHASLQKQLVELISPLVGYVQSTFTSVRHLSSRCFAVLSKIQTDETMDALVHDVIPLLSISDNLMARQGAIEAIVNVLDSLRLNVLPYLVLLIVPVLSRMSDQEECVRTIAASCFASLVQIMPLESGAADPPLMSADLVKKKIEERKFLHQLLDGTKLDTFSIPIKIKTDLRKYQQDGVNWLAFLNKYNLHGVLCDDMGLGKTLQSICIMAGDHFNQLKKYKLSNKDQHKPLPSLVICPPTLTGHWFYEVLKFCDKAHLNPLNYSGSVTERSCLQTEFRNSDYNLVVASYDIVRNDSDFFLSINWNYCILDEGHVIKNGKSKVARVIKQLYAAHRLVLSGTPIQNNVLELWSLFDFLMPGFLGTEREFNARFGRPIIQSRDAKSSSKEQEAGALAMEALHKQTLPFMLRRLKEDVLQDLPPKIIQDYYCELSPLQVKLYEDFAQQSQSKQLISSESNEKQSGEVKKVAGHIFQALQYLRKVCNHPSLALTTSHPEYNTIIAQLQVKNTPLKDIQHSAKLVALKQLLLDCGIGSADGDTSSVAMETASVVSQHRALVFCQHVSMLDCIENDLLKAHMSSVTYSRMDGSTPAGDRHNLVQRFNNDPSIDLLLLTTHVGGLGLNLTGADTVIFVEHDWNPMKDLQAMDRAHRIGQKKVVNVYRLIARGTLEEKIMGLQKFKLNIANTVLTQDNSSLQSMETTQLLDLFSIDSSKSAPGGGGEKFAAAADVPSGKSSMSAVLQEMGDLWDSEQYATEYDVNSFLESFQ